MKKINMRFLDKIAIIVVSLIIFSGCQTEDIGDGNGLSTEGLNSGFTITPGSNANTFNLASSPNSTDFVFHFWNFDDGAGSVAGTADKSLFLPDVGVYNITHNVYGKGGSAATPTTQIITVTTPDPVSGNLVEGGKLDTNSDISKWTVLNISASGTSWAFANGKATVTGGGWNQQGFYQAISVVSGRTYKVDMVASSTSGVSNTWFEVFVSPTIPIQNNDYSAGGKIRSINTWAGCGGSAFSGKISSVGCGGTDNVGTYKATATGTVYLVIKCGGENLKDGISVDNIELRGI
ncbi:hypothetical protein E0I26_13260 [Flavobacterium rhamnosiphilum]|uniref:PKD domain-containing protein n=1 Tax=Flavobacterium rhamnosiphilum TaxID=2541724 RepID=A0A4V6PGC1_9FLAO|nr:hypothetical protein [Flavobacterium rhamnosiphilum]TDE42439.1 hypothetical protein E0I26_13260 [Flavobacterium rhamnosiphilum]